MRYLIIISLFLFIGCTKRPVGEQVKEAAQTITNSNRPSNEDYSNTTLQQLRVPEGFQINIFAQDLGNARMMVVDSNGTIYLSRFDDGIVTELTDNNGDGRADNIRDVITGLKGVHGLAIRNGKMYVATIKEILVYTIASDGSLTSPKTIVNDLPEGGRHPKRTLAFGPDNMLYVSIGSSCNACEENDSRYATILRMDSNGKSSTIFSRGLRNTIGFDWHHTTHDLWGMDNGTDLRGDNQPPEELNKLTQGSDYGWPYVFGNRQSDPELPAPKGSDPNNYAISTIPSILDYQAHSAPIGFTFYRGSQFPEEYRDDAFVAFRGSWNRTVPTGYKVVRILYENGEPKGFEDFVTGWLTPNKKSELGRVAGVTVTKDGSLLISEDENGVIYRVSYQGHK